MTFIPIEGKSKSYKHSLIIYWTALVHVYFNSISIKLMKGKSLRKHSLHEKTAVSVLLKLFISGNEWWHTTDAP